MTKSNTKRKMQTTNNLNSNEGNAFAVKKERSMRMKVKYSFASIYSGIRDDIKATTSNNVLNSTI